MTRTNFKLLSKKFNQLSGWRVSCKRQLLFSCDSPSNAIVGASVHVSYYVYELTAVTWAHYTFIHPSSSTSLHYSQLLPSTSPYPAQLSIPFTPLTPAFASTFHNSCPFSTWYASYASSSTSSSFTSSPPPLSHASSLSHSLQGVQTFLVYKISFSCSVTFMLLKEKSLYQWINCLFRRLQAVTNATRFHFATAFCVT